MLTSAFWTSTGGERGVRWTLFVFAALCLFVGCTDPASTNRSLIELKNKLDQLETQISDRNGSQGSRVGSVIGTDETRVFFHGQNKLSQTEANRLFRMCMEARGWTTPRN